MASSSHNGHGHNDDVPVRPEAEELQPVPRRSGRYPPRGSTRSASAPTVTVQAVMHQGMISIAPQCTLADAAAEMARYGVHCVVIDGLAQAGDSQERLVWTILSDVDLMRAVAAGCLDVLAGDLALSELVTIDPSDTIEFAARLMGKHEITHIVVVEPTTAQPAGVVSSLDIAGVLARN